MFIIKLKYGFKTEPNNPDFYYYTHLGGIIWYLLFSFVFVFDLKLKKISVKKIVNLDFRILKKNIKSILLYFSGAGAFVIIISLVNKKTQLKLENQEPLSIILILLSAIIMAPVCEEFIFRGYLYTAMLSRFKRKRERMVVNAMLFAGAHVFLVEFLLGATVPYYIFVMGFLLAKLYEENRSILPCIVLHCLNNSLVCFMDWIKMSG